MSHQSELVTSNIEAYLKEHENKELLRFITCGSVDDGKSTLIGRLLYDSKMIFEDQLAAIEKDSKKAGTQNGELDLALLVDGLQSEREQGITIDVAYRFFTTDKRKFIIADTPGHEQYTRNMATGASTADLAIILIDARYGVQEQTKRHTYIVSLLGIKKILVAINKMDLVGFSKSRFDEIQSDYSSMVKTIVHHEQIEFQYIPISALKGDNVVNLSKQMAWYEGHPLMEILDTIDIKIDNHTDANFRFPIQYVNRPNLDFRGYCGTIASGKIKVGDEITVLPSGKTTKVKSIIIPTVPSTSSGEVDEACAPMAITLTTEDEIDIGRGDILVRTHNLPRVSNSFKVKIVWMDKEPMIPERNYYIKAASALTSGYFKHINYKVDVNTFEKIQVNELQLNDIASCKMILNRPLVVDPYLANRLTGSFIVIDRVTNSTVAAGMIEDVSRRDLDDLSGTGRVYTKAEIELNAFIRKYFPEWECKAV